MRDSQSTQEASAKAPVLVLGWIPRIVLTIARSLHRHGIPVDVADCISNQPLRSRAIRHIFLLPNPSDSPNAFLRELRSLIAKGGHDMLIPADDRSIAAVMEHYDDLKEIIRISCLPPEIMQSVLNKTLTLQAAQRCGVRAPRTAVAINSTDLLKLAGEIPFPWILKPAEKEKRGEEFTSCRLDNIEAVAHKYPEACRFAPPMLVQEYCEGGGVGIEVLLHEGQCLLAFQHRRLKEFPHAGGVAVTAIAERPDPKLVDLSLRLLQELRWDGVAMVEFRVNHSTGEAVLMEVNGRFWGSISLPVAAGLDFPYYQWQLAHGEQPSIPAEYAVGTRWRWTVGYFYRLYWLFVFARHLREARVELKRTLSQVFSDFNFSIRDAMFDLKDPVPAILEAGRNAKSLAKRSIAVLIRRLPMMFGESPVQKATHD
jgi:predicted ATP-grasp superfamily ATP-dependent carboligase